MKKMQPAEVIVAKFGGVRATARAVNRSPGTIGYWLKPISRGGAGGRIPKTSHKDILKAAKRLHVRCYPKDLVTTIMVS